jgi:hypothetical protein
MLSSPDGFLPEDPDESLPGEGLERWDTEAGVVCPYCGETVTVGLDPGGGTVQTYVEDCQVCCQPWRVSVTDGDSGRAQVEVEPK